MKIQKNFKVTPADPHNLIDFLASKVSELSKQKIKGILAQGGVWRKGKRLRRSQMDILDNEIIEFNYDSQISFPEFSEPKALKELRDFGIWYKPAGIMSQGNEYGDEGSMMRALEKKRKEVYLVHRLDRETAGLMVFAYHSKMAGRLGTMFKDKKIQKFYRAIVLGKAEDCEIKFPLDGKEAHSSVRLIKELDGKSLVEVQIHTGRTHQIRRHLEMIGLPVIGDPKYGQNNKNTDGLQLVAHRLVIPEFKIDISLAPEDSLQF